jgi:hypothetical protein
MSEAIEEPIEKHDANGNLTYFEESNGFWFLYEYDDDGGIIYYEDSSGNTLKDL